MSWIFIVIAHWNNGLQLVMSLHSNTIFRFWANQFLLLLFSDACLAEKEQISILESLVWPDQSKNPDLSHLKKVS